MTESHIRNVIEAALLAAGKPLQAGELVDLFDEGASRPTLAVVHAALAALAEEYANRGIEIKETAAGFRIQVRADFTNEISRLWPERPAKYSRALLETLAIIAYRQPITRAEIEAVRGVAVNPNIVKTVIERNWVHVVGHRDVPGRPELLGTTRDFLDYFGLKRLDELPPLAELKSIGEIKVQFDLPDPGPLALASDGTANESRAAGDVANTEANGGAAAGDAGAADAGAANTEANGEEAAGGNAEAPNAAAANTEAHGEVVAGDAGAADAANTEASDSTVVATDVAAGGPEATAAVGDDGASVAHEGAATEASAKTGSTEPAEDADGATHAHAAAERAFADDDSAARAAANETPAADVVAVGEDTEEKVSKKSSKSAGRGSGGKKKRGKARSSDTALHEAEEFAASVDADLAAGDDDSSDDDELSAAGPDSSELVAGPRDIDD